VGGFHRWLWQASRGFAPLGRSRSDSAARRGQGDANDSFITQLRAEMRGVLSRAHEAGKMPWEVAQLEGFANTPACAGELNAIDREESDDDEGEVRISESVAAQIVKLKLMGATAANSIDVDS